MGLNVPNTVRRVRRLASLALSAGVPPVPRRGKQACEIVTLDVFDTLLMWRDPLAPDIAIWRHLALRAERLRLVPNACDFVTHRKEATKRLLATDANHVLENIYGLIGAEFHLSPSIATRLGLLELEVTAEHLDVIPGASERVAAARRNSSDGHVIFISDMYLPSAFIRSQLIRADCWTDNDRIWVSGESGAKKSQGRLYRLVAAYEDRVGNTRFRHTGDDALADVTAARWSGFAVMPFTTARLTRYERMLAKPRAQSDEGAPQVAAASRRSRLELLASEAHLDEELAGLLTGVAAPLFVGYAFWLLDQARLRGFDRIYFLARDGYRLLEVTAAVARARRQTIDLRYLYGGRRAWRLPSLAAVQDNEGLARHAAKAIRTSKATTMAELAADLSVPSATIIRLLANLNPDQVSDDMPIDYEVRRGLIERCKSEEGMTLLAKDAEQQLTRCRRYLKQQGLYSENWGLADVGWRGSAAFDLARLLTDSRRSPIEGFYIGYFGDTRAESLANGQGYLWDDDKGAIRPTGAISIVEAWCRTGDAPVLGYIDRDGRTVPNLSGVPYSAPDRATIEIAERAIQRFCEEIAPSIRSDEVDSVPARTVEDMMDALCRTPTVQEARAMGGFEREVGPTARPSGPLVRPLSVRDAFALATRRSNLPWPRGSIAASNRLMRHLGALARISARSRQSHRVG